MVGRSVCIVSAPGRAVADDRGIDNGGAPAENFEEGLRRCAASRLVDDSGKLGDHARATGFHRGEGVVEVLREGISDDDAVALCEVEDAALAELPILSLRGDDPRVVGGQVGGELDQTIPGPAPRGSCQRCDVRCHAYGDVACIARLYVTRARRADEA